MDASEINLNCSSCRWLWGELESLRTTVQQIHKQVAELQLEAMNLTSDELTPEQIAYLKSWQEGT